MLTGIFTFLSNATPYKSVKTGTVYFKALFMSANGKLLELSVPSPIVAQELTKHILVVDVIQGKYPQFNLVSCEVAK